MQKILAAVITAVALLVPAIVQAHEGHGHTYRGTISAINAPTLELKTTDGKALVFAIDEKTRILRGKVRVDIKAIRGGERAVVSALEVPAGKTMTAQRIELAAPAPTTN